MYVWHFTEKNPRQGLTLAFPSTASRQTSDSPSRSHPSIQQSFSDDGELARRGYGTQMYADR